MCGRNDSSCVSVTQVNTTGSLETKCASENCQSTAIVSVCLMTVVSRSRACDLSLRFKHDIDIRILSLFCLYSFIYLPVIY